MPTRPVPIDDAISVNTMDSQPWQNALLIIPVPVDVSPTKYLVCVQCIDPKKEWFKYARESKNKRCSEKNTISPQACWDKDPIRNLNEIFKAVGWEPYDQMAIPSIGNGERKGTIAVGVGTTKVKKERAASCAICFANDLQLPREIRQTKEMEYTDSILLEKILEYATRMAAGIHPVTEGLLVDLTDEQEPDLNLVTKEVTIPQLKGPSGSHLIVTDETEPDWG